MKAKSTEQESAFTSDTPLAEPRVTVRAKPVAAPCRFVMFHHGADKVDHPAIVLQVRKDGTTVDGIDEEGNSTVETVPVVQLIVLRPRAIEWVWAMEGVNPGQYSWPVIT
jgi:hypothetical protein